MDQEQDSRDTKTKERKRDNNTSSSDESRICSSSDNNNGQIQSFAKTNSKKASISSSRISANNHDDEPMNYEEENDSYCSNDEGRRNLPPHNNNFSPPPDKALYATTIPTTTSNSNNRSGAVETSDEINHQSGESCESSNDEKLLRQHDAEKRMEANRLRAKATRRKKKVMIEEMHSKIFELTAENEQLQNQNQNQHAEIEFLRNIQGGQHQQQVSLYDFIDFYGGARRISIIPPCIVHEYIHGIEWVLITAFAHSRISQCSHYHHLCKTQWPIEETELL